MGNLRSTRSYLSPFKGRRDRFVNEIDRCSIFSDCDEDIEQRKFDKRREFMSKDKKKSREVEWKRL
jgi:hypothetical protein